jgi:hypothetical protein
MVVKASLLSSCLMLLTLAGCAKHERVLNPKVSTTPVVFESDQAQSAFGDAVRDRYDAGGAERPPGKLSKNAYYNQEIAEADRDGDGIISDSEAYRYIGH